MGITLDMGETMNFGRKVAIPAAVACMLSSPFAILPCAAQADELSDAKAKNEVPQQRIDQLAQIPAPGAVYPGGPPAPSAGAGIVGGSFPRSFLIPGTDTSLRVGGEIRANLTFFFNGGSPNGSPQSTNVLNNGALNTTALNFHNTLNAAGAVVATSNPARSRTSSITTLSPQQTKFNFETRTPTALGEARTFIELDFAGGSAFSPGTGAAAGGGANGPLASSDNLTPRLRYAYGTLGGFLAGQANSNFSDPDADPPQLEFGGNVGNPGVTRIPQLRYTVPLQPYGLLGAISVSAEAPETEALTAGQGQIASDTGGTTITANPALACTVAGTTATCSIPGNLVAVNPTKSPAPDLTAAWYIPQPWGHFDMSLVYRPTLQLKDVLFVDKTL